MNPQNYYYRRVFVKAVRAVEAACQHPLVDTTRLAAMGGSQGGGGDAQSLCSQGKGKYRKKLAVCETQPAF